jgi:hypothetical protein
MGPDFAFVETRWQLLYYYLDLLKIIHRERAWNGPLNKIVDYNYIVLSLQLKKKCKR